MVLPHDDLGRGPAVVLLHAGVADRGMWAELSPAIAGAGFRAIAVDLPGFGDAAVAAAAGPHAAVLDTLDALEVPRAAIVGASFGGAVALRVAVTAPQRVRGLLLVSTPADEVEPSAELEAAWAAEESALERNDIEAAVAAVLDAWVLPDAPDDLRERIARMQRRAFELQADGVEPASGEDPLERDPAALEALDVRTVVAYGEHDMPDFRLGAEQLAGRLRSPPAVAIPGAGHLAPLEQPQVFRELALAFLDDVHDRGRPEGA